MKSPRNYALVLVTAPDLKTARALAKATLSERLVACVNLIPNVESHYLWKGKMATGAEVLMLFKTAPSKLRALEKAVLRNHPYDTPEFVVLNIMAGNERYLDWLRRSLAAG